MYRRQRQHYDHRKQYYEVTFARVYVTCGQRARNEIDRSERAVLNRQEEMFFVVFLSLSAPIVLPPSTLGHLLVLPLPFLSSRVLFNHVSLSSSLDTR